MAALCGAEAAAAATVTGRVRVRGRLAPAACRGDADGLAVAAPVGRAPGRAGVRPCSMSVTTPAAMTTTAAAAVIAVHLPFGGLPSRELLVRVWLAGAAGSESASPGRAGPVPAGLAANGPKPAGLAAAGPVPAEREAAGPEPAGREAAGPVPAGLDAAGLDAAGLASAGYGTAGAGLPGAARGVSCFPVLPGVGVPDAAVQLRGTTGAASAIAGGRAPRPVDWT